MFYVGPLDVRDNERRLYKNSLIYLFICLENLMREDSLLNLVYSLSKQLLFHKLNTLATLFIKGFFL